MLIFHRITDIRTYLDHQRSAAIKIGFVPTMGALHQGHLSLIQQSQQQTQLTVCSIFVNPTQFNDPKDFEKYPVTIDVDIQLLINAGTDVLFLPDVKEMYPDGITHPLHYDLGYLETVLEGTYRPGHFQGVCQIMDRLLSVVEADALFMGQKDYQQCMVIKKLIELTGSATKLHVAATLRETDGLAMSSRNIRLNQAERETAVSIFQTLMQMKEQLQPGNVVQLKEAASVFLTKKGFRVDYTELANADTLELMDDWNGTDRIVALVAAYLNEVRLIDNMIISS